MKQPGFTPALDVHIEGSENVVADMAQLQGAGPRGAVYAAPRVVELGETKSLLLGTWDEGYADWSAHYYHVSDRRLKSHIRAAGTSSNGIALYEFRYRGDDSVFIGVMAQDLLVHPVHGQAVKRGLSGFYRVDYARLGLTDLVSREMLDAGLAAEARVGQVAGKRAA